ncbi:hypothetical protein JB92DRAFT_2840482 [Gautieria morchelliformis]|nr:hypothetical protein JB92DRAFT_2840482 [Gautieria morchelliformis]
MYLPFEAWSHVFCQLPNNSQTQLMRGGCPLDVVLKIPLGVTDLRPTLVLLHSHVRRFRVLNIDVPTSGIADTILSSIALSEGRCNGNTAPLLEELCITIDEILTVSPLRILAPSSKLLSTVSALMIVSGPDDQVTPIEWVLNTIAAIPHLKYLKYSGYHFFSFQPSHSLDYPHLKVLPHLEEVDVTVPGCGLDILQCLEAPTL